MTFPYPPSDNHLYATFRGRRILSAEGRSYHATIAAMAIDQGCRRINGDVVATIRLYRPQKSGDLQGRFKAVFDGLNGIAYIDDRQVVRIVADRFDDKENPRVEIEIEAA